MELRDLSEYLTRYNKEKAQHSDPIKFRRSYLSNLSPWRESLCVESYSTDVVLGVDPGTFFCGGLVRFLADLGAELNIPTGFIHVPPDADSVEGPSSLLPRAALMNCLYELLNRIVCRLSTSGRNDPIKVFLWGFSEFGVIVSNPTEHFLSEGGKALLTGDFLEKDGLYVQCPTLPNSFAFYPLVFKLAESSECAKRGNYFVTMEHVYREAERQYKLFGAPDVVIGLGVDASQLTSPFVNPTFIVELQSQGFCSDGQAINSPFLKSIYTINCSLVPYLVEGAT